jgi:hypothetical protein
MRTPLYRKLKKAGCYRIGYGLETPSPRLLEEIGKVISKDADISLILGEGKKAGIYIKINIMFGLPGETEEDFNLLIEFLKKHHSSFDEIYPSIGFCVFSLGSDGGENPAKYGLDLAKGPLYWESIDKTNTYPIRMRRFELFCKMAKKYRLADFVSRIQFLNRNRLLFKYYFISRKYDKALAEYDKIVPSERTAELERMHTAIKTNDFTILRRDPIKLCNILQYGKTFKDTFLTASLIKNLDDIKDVDIFDIPLQAPWKRKVRSLIHLAIGYDLIEKKINNLYSVLKIIDEKIGH